MPEEQVVLNQLFLQVVRQKCEGRAATGMHSGGMENHRPQSVTAWLPHESRASNRQGMIWPRTPRIDAATFQWGEEACEKEDGIRKVIDAIVSHVREDRYEQFKKLIHSDISSRYYDEYIKAISFYSEEDPMHVFSGF